MINNSKPKKHAILHICKVYFPVKGGVQKVVHSIIGLTQKFNHHVLTSGKDGAVSNQNLDGSMVTRCRSYIEIASMPIAPSLVAKTIRHVKKSQLICVHYPFPLADLALLMVFKAPPVVVFWHSNIVVQKKLKWLTYPFIYFTLRRAKVIVATSERMIDNSTLLTRFKAKVQIIPYGLPAINYMSSRREIRDEYFVLVGRHVSYKGIDVAINALQNVKTRLLIAGDGPLFERHKLLAQTLGVSDRIVFKTNASDDEIIGFIQNSIALIVPSVMHNEAFALVQVEAMRLKRPVINTFLPSSVPVIARDQKEGITIEPKNHFALASAMNQMLSNRDWAAGLGENGYKRFNEQFTDLKFQEALTTLFDDLLAIKQ